MEPERDHPDSELPAELVERGLRRVLLDGLNSGVRVLDRDRRIVYWNPACTEITGYLRQEVIHQPCDRDLLMHCCASGKVMCANGCPVEQALALGTSRTDVVFLRHKHGHRLPVRTSWYPIADGAGTIVAVLETMHARPGIAAEAELLEPAGCVDEPGGAFSRRYGETRARHLLEEADTFGVPLGWITFRLKDSKRLSQNFGHGIIDAALAVVAQTLRANAPPRSVLVRWEKEQLGLAVPHANDGQIHDHARRLVALANASTVEWWGEARSVAVLAGVATAHAGDTVGRLEARASDPAHCVNLVQIL